VWDVQAAKRAGVRIISLTCGGISGCELSGAGADEVFDGPADLVDRWDDSLLAKLV
jgi:phosphoglycolate phosphatase-like HAD superfamily hydrolase